MTEIYYDPYDFEIDADPYPELIVAHGANGIVSVLYGSSGAEYADAIGLRVGLAVARDFRDRGEGLTADALAERLAVPVRTMREVLRALEAAGVVSPRGAVELEGGYQLGRPAEDIAVLDVIAALRGRLEAVSGPSQVRELVGRVMGEIEEGAIKSAAGRSLADLLALLPALEEAESQTASRVGGVSG